MSDEKKLPYELTRITGPLKEAQFGILLRLCRHICAIQDADENAEITDVELANVDFADAACMARALVNAAIDLEARELHGQLP